MNSDEPRYAVPPHIVSLQARDMLAQMRRRWEHQTVFYAGDVIDTLNALYYDVPAYSERP